MDLVSVCPFQAGKLIWQPRASTWVLTVVSKATFLLRPGECTLAPEQEPPVEADTHWNDDPNRSLRTANDLIPVKPRADVMLVGHAFAPGGAPVRSLVARLVVGEIDKAIEVCNDRVVSPSGTVQEGGPYARLPIIYERAAGGPGTSNPAGIRAEARDAYGRRILPNLIPPGVHVADMTSLIEPVGFGPLAATWPTRLEKLGAHAGHFPADGYRERPLPEGINLGFFNQSPRDQQLAELRDNERIVLENLHPEHPRLVTNLPGFRPAVFVVRPRSPSPQRIPLRADTLVIDTDRSLVTLVFRGQIALERRDELLRIAVLLETANQKVTPAEAERALAHPVVDSIDVSNADEDSNDLAGTMTLVPSSGATTKAAPLPFTGAKSAPAVPSAPPPTGALPFQAAQAPPPPPPRAPSASSPWIPVAQPPPIAQPAPVARANTPESPWAAGAGENKQQAETFGMAAASAAAVAIAPPHVDESSRGGAAAASNAAAGAAPWSVPKRELSPLPRGSSAHGLEPTNEVLTLLWYDFDSVPRIRRHAKWRSVLDELEKKPLDRELEDPALAKDPMEAEDRREVFEIVAHGAQSDALGVEEAFVGAIREGGKLVPPLVLLAGELETPFDELATLRATVSTAVPLVTPTDEGLKAAVAIAKEFLGTPDLAAAPAVCEGLSVRIRDAFHREKKSMPADYLDTQVERFLLSGRHYQKREVFGEAHLRVLIWLPGETNGLVGYLSAGLAKKLPMWRRFRARVIAEVHPAQDQYEGQVRALRLVAVGRSGNGGKA